jgi:hypothetical protein
LAIEMEDDPIIVRRRQMARWAGMGQRAGYLLFLAAVVLFLAALASNLPRVLTTAVVVALVAGSVLLLPSIVVGYGVRAADREDVERERPSGTNPG